MTWPVGGAVSVGGGRRETAWQNRKLSSAAHPTCARNSLKLPHVKEEQIDFPTVSGLFHCSNKGRISQIQISFFCWIYILIITEVSLLVWAPPAAPFLCLVMWLIWLTQMVTGKLDWNTEEVISLACYHSYRLWRQSWVDLTNLDKEFWENAPDYTLQSYTSLSNSKGNKGQILLWTSSQDKTDLATILNDLSCWLNHLFFTKMKNLI